MKVEIPQAVLATLWSYDSEKLDYERDKERIITNVLNLGTKEALDWLFGTYSRDDIMSFVLHPRPGEWNRKSLTFWGVVFGVETKPVSRF